MKRFIISLLCMIFSVITFGQQKIEEVKVTPPKFTGETLAIEAASINEYLAKKIICPEKDAEFGIQGTVVIQFTITESGSVNDFKIINSLSSAIDEEVIRVLKTTSGMWKPGYNNDEPTSMEKEISLAFKDAGEGGSNSIMKNFKALASRSFKRASNLFVKKGKPQRALKYYNYSISLLPNDKALLLMRGLCQYQLNNKEGAFHDWNRLKELGGNDYMMIYYNSPDIANMSGYEDMLSFFAE